MLLCSTQAATGTPFRHKLKPVPTYPGCPSESGSGADGTTSPEPLTQPQPLGSAALTAAMPAPRKQQRAAVYAKTCISLRKKYLKLLAGPATSTDAAAASD